MSDTPAYLGIDLGTTNSAAAVFDNEKMEMVRSAQGGVLTPSVVRIDGRGNVIVGARARRFLETDPNNTRSEFKRLMGSDSRIEFPTAKASRSPQELAAEVLRSILRDVADQFGFSPTRAVISVPALFELPQSSATSEAARMAGLTEVELIQEPIASALAAGWTEAEAKGYWLVYDLGGGTFDASLLETRDGFLRVVGHDGDNFLGGRDFDAAIVDWALTEFNEESGLSISRSRPEDGAIVRKIRQAAEEAKIELSRIAESALSLPDLVDGHDLDLALDRARFRGLTQALVDRSIAVCKRLLSAHRVSPGELRRIVMVGGPTLIPFLRERVSEALEAPFGEGLDPMTLVAQGAAIFAASAGLNARPVIAPVETGRRLWLHYPPISTDLRPHVVGRLVGEQESPPLHAVRARRADGWESREAVLDGENAFVLSLELVPRKPSDFHLQGLDSKGNAIAVQPSSITLVQGVTIGDPPLSRTIGVALANNRVRVYFDRGSPLPARRTFTHHTVETVLAGAADFALRIPIVQGDFERADLCRLVGTLEIPGRDLRETLPPNTSIEVTIDVDRSARMSARALIPSLGQVFEQVAHLRVPDASPETLDRTLAALHKRLQDLRRVKSGKDLVELMEIELALSNAVHDIEAARGGDDDAGQKARRVLQEIDARLDGLEARQHMTQLSDDAQGTLLWASETVSLYGTPQEVKLFNELSDAVSRAREEEDVVELQRRLGQVRRLGNAAWFRQPEAWSLAFERTCSHIDRATDLPRAHKLMEEGRAAQRKNDHGGLRRVVEALWNLLPDDPSTRLRGHDSSVR
jgi:molecular chaperone DnaK